MSARFSAFQLSCFFLFSLFGSFVHTRFGICVLVLVQCWLYCVCRLCEFRANLCVHTVGIVSSCEFRFVGARSFCALMYTSNSYSFMFLLMYFDLLVFFVYSTICVDVFVLCRRKLQDLCGMDDVRRIWTFGGQSGGDAYTAAVVWGKRIVIKY